MVDQLLTEDPTVILTKPLPEMPVPPEPLELTEPLLTVDPIVILTNPHPEALEPLMGLDGGVIKAKRREKFLEMGNQGLS